MKDKRIAIYPGTFDPMTLGHFDIVKKAVKIVDQLVVGVAVDTVKDTFFSIEERVSIVNQSVQYLNKGTSVLVKPFSGLLTDFARREDAFLIIRGLRAVSDFEYEFKMSWVLNRMYSNIQTIFLPASDATQFISSNFVKEIACLGGDISQFVYPHVVDAFKKRKQ
ncbi:MAG: pantetheine-phosphate adenylyltransferase [Candidatus Xenolissoclinum pacificiensis L6]|uniref:Phosphopantetheine adenylyltransferase n=1 Tax=Candidatus Xenolissoclinum pacificiensis L6 TaxID=1401685 RepID=W2UZ12_9RICK|nr:MAG: pantetheine-phosphate adenylyltransferase [Candidatus Xenolissoclinum pacificiensis L6]